jgi:hypothetical protein
VGTSEPRGLARYATSTKNIVGCTFAIGGPVLALVGVLSPPIGLALAPVLYAIGALATPPKKRAPGVPGLDEAEVRRSLAELAHRTEGRVPAEIATKVSRISSTIADTLPRADELGPGSPGLFVLTQCATDYLPTALQAYLDLPRSYADQKIVDQGKTPLALLSEQLDLLGNEIDEVADAVNRADTDKLVANGRFLAEKFGRGPLDIDGAATDAPAPPTKRAEPPAPGTP